MEIMNFIENLNWQGIISLIAVVWFFTYEMKKDIFVRMDKLEKRMDYLDERMTSLEERIFLLATGKTLTQAMLDIKIKELERKKSE